jgi:hypothetical protein
MLGVGKPLILVLIKEGTIRTARIRKRVIVSVQSLRDFVDGKNAPCDPIENSDVPQGERLPIGGEHSLAGNTGFLGIRGVKAVSEGDICVANMCDGGGRPHLGGYSGERRVAPTPAFSRKNSEKT